MSTSTGYHIRFDRRLAGLALAVVVFLGSWEALHYGFYSHNPITDTPVYHGYARATRAGDLPYRDFAVVYPPGALPVFYAPTVIDVGYATAFGWLMAACGVCCLGFVAASRPPRIALPFVAVSPLLLGSVALSRFDFWPTAFITGALAALLHERHRLGWAALSAAVAIKLFAVVLVPLALVWTCRRRGRAELARGVAILAAVVASAFVPFALLAPRGLWASLSGQLSRPLQIETLAASFLMTVGHPHVIRTHGSFNLAGEDSVAAAFAVLSLVVLLALWVSFARGRADPDRLVRYGAACICAFVVFGKVLSPQFLIWLVPLVPLARGRRGIAATALLVAALVDTAVWFPSRYFQYVNQGHLAWLVLIRNLLLLALLGVLSLPARERVRSS